MAGRLIHGVGPKQAGGVLADKHRKPGLQEMPVERKRLAHASPFHQFKANAVNPVPLFVGKPAAAFPACFQQIFADRDHFDLSGGTERAGHVQSRPLVQAFGEERERLRENPFVQKESAFGVGVDRAQRLMLAVISVGESKDRSGVGKDRRLHGLPS
jgi:hypothetical protein